MYNTFVYSTAVWIIPDCYLVAVYTTLYYICDRIWKNPASTHTISNLRFYQEWIAGSIHYHIPLRAWLVVALLYWCSGGWVSHKWLANVFIFNSECCEHKEHPLGPQIGPLAFNRLHIPFNTPILSTPSTPALPHAILLLSWKKLLKNSLNSGCLRYSPTQL